MGQAPTLDHGLSRGGSARPAAGVRYAPPVAAHGGGNGRLAPACLPALLDVPEAVLQQVVRLPPPLQRHQSLFEGGNNHGQLFIVLSGYLQSSVQAENGDEQIVGFHLPGDVAGFGAASGAGGGRAVALARSSVCAIRLDALFELAARVDGLQAQLYGLIERALADSEQHVLMMGRRNSWERVALFLDSWSRRLRAAGFGSRDLELPMRREDIASYIGLATETASRAISRLHQSGIIAVHNRHVEIRDPDRLAAMAGTDTDAAANAGAETRPALAARR